MGERINKKLGWLIPLVVFLIVFVPTVVVPLFNPVTVDNPIQQKAWMRKAEEISGIKGINNMNSTDLEFVGTALLIESMEANNNKLLRPMWAFVSIFAAVAISYVGKSRNWF